MNKEEREEKIVEMRKQGATYKQIRKALGISENIVWKALRKNEMTNNEEINEEIEQIKEMKVKELQEQKEYQEQLVKNKQEEEKRRRQEREEKIIEMRKQGATYKQIMEVLHISEHIVWTVLSENEMTNKTESKKVGEKQKQEEEKRQERNQKIVEMRKQGASYKQIRKALGISENIVARILRENGMTNNEEVDKLLEQINEIKLEEIQEQKEKERQELENKTEEEKIKRQKKKEEKRQERNKKIVEMRKQGATYKQIMEVLHISENTVWKVLRQNEITNKKEENQVEETQNNQLNDKKYEMKSTEQGVICKDEEKFSILIKNIYDKKKKIEADEFNNLIELNYDKIQIEDLILITKILTRQGETLQAIKYINALIYSQEYNNISKEKLEEILKLLKKHQIKENIIRRLKSNKSTKEISDEIGISETQVIKIKKQWEEKMCKNSNNPPQDPKKGMGIGE